MTMEQVARAVDHLLDNGIEPLTVNDAYHAHLLNKYDRIKKNWKPGDKYFLVDFQKCHNAPLEQFPFPCELAVRREDEDEAATATLH